MASCILFHFNTYVVLRFRIELWADRCLEKSTSVITLEHLNSELYYICIHITLDIRGECVRLTCHYIIIFLRRDFDYLLYSLYEKVGYINYFLYAGFNALLLCIGKRSFFIISQSSRAVDI